MLDSLRRAIAWKTRSLQSRLSGVDGYTGSGRFRYSVWSSGYVTFEVELRGVAGLKAEVWAKGAKVGRLAVADGRSAAGFDSRIDAPTISLTDGDVVEVRQNGDLILRGLLQATREPIWRRLRGRP